MNIKPRTIFPNITGIFGAPSTHPFISFSGTKSAHFSLQSKSLQNYWIRYRSTFENIPNYNLFWALPRKLSNAINIIILIIINYASVLITWCFRTDYSRSERRGRSSSRIGHCSTLAHCKVPHARDTCRRLTSGPPRSSKNVNDIASVHIIVVEMIYCF